MRYEFVSYLRVRAILATRVNVGGNERMAIVDLQHRRTIYSHDEDKDQFCKEGGTYADPDERL